jgi:hypothetical protein
LFLQHRDVAGLDTSGVFPLHVGAECH